MIKDILKQSVSEIKLHKKDIVNKLLEFARTDLLFFWAEKKELLLRQQEQWFPILEWAENLMNITLSKTQSLDMPKNDVLQNPLAEILQKMTDKELACFYLAALNMRSVLLALALIKRRITAETAYQLSYLEELWQNEKWGIEEEAVCRREERHKELLEIESFLLL